MVKRLIMVDTAEFTRWAYKKYNMTNNEWHKKVWRPFMCDYFQGEAYISFQKFEEPDNVFEEQINDFLDDNPELNGTVNFIFTN